MWHFKDEKLLSVLLISGVEVAVSPDERLSIPLARIKIHQCPARGTRGCSEYLNSCSKKNPLPRGCYRIRIYDPGELLKNITSTNNYEHRGAFKANAIQEHA
jgi:hypothetical protein